MLFFSTELMLALILAIIGFVIEFGYLIIGLKETTSNSKIYMWSTILSRFFYEKYGTLSLIHFSICDFYITMLLLLYISMMILKFFGYHMTKNNKISGHYFNDLFLIVILCIFCRLSFCVYN